MEFVYFLSLLFLCFLFQQKEFQATGLWFWRSWCVSGEALLAVLYQFGFLWC
jgi:hypothetical protein